MRSGRALIYYPPRGSLAQNLRCFIRAQAHLRTIPKGLVSTADHSDPKGLKKILLYLGHLAKYTAMRYLLNNVSNDNSVNIEYLAIRSRQSSLL